MTRFEHAYMCRTLQVLIGVVVLLGFRSPAEAQYVHFDRDEDGEVVGAAYQGNAKWLVDQKAPESHFHTLPRLESLLLVHHAVSFEEMTYVSRLKGIKDLELGIGPESLEIERRTFALVGRMTGLEGLSFCIDGLADDDLKALTNLQCLSYLDIDNMDVVFRGGKKLVFERGLTDAAAEHLVQLESLEWLRISGHHDLSDAFIEKLAKLPKLRRLEVQSPRFTDKALSILASDYKLRDICIGSTQITDEGVRSLGRCRSLEEIEVKSPNISAKAVSALKLLSRLRRLSLSIEQIEPDTMQTLAQMKSLEFMPLAHVPITDDELAKLSGHPGIRTLFLNGAKLTMRSLDVFKSMERLEYVDLGFAARSSELQAKVNEYLESKQAQRKRSTEGVE